MKYNVEIRIGNGDTGLERYHEISADFLPPVGSRIAVDKHVTGDGNIMLDVTGIEWFLKNVPNDDESVDVRYYSVLSPRIQTKEVPWDSK